MIKIIDINAWLGHYHWRQLRHNDAASLVALMDKVGIDNAVVSSIEAIYYNNPQPGNEQLYADVLRYPERLIPFATINPTYADWERDLAVCHEEWGMRGLRAFPVHHGYTLNDTSCRALLAAAAERHLPVAFAARLVDRRQHHWLDTTTDLDQTLLASTIVSHPNNRFMILNSLAPANTWAACADSQVLFDIARMTTLDIALSPKSFNIPSLGEAVGMRHLAFGSGIPFSVPQVALLKMSSLRTDEATKTAIGATNAARMLGIEVI
ncbi:MAG: amidohydrolase family protein [Anaerolineae bacterium]